jgi:hypothetical protein
MGNGFILLEGDKVLILKGLYSLVSTQIGNLLSRKVSLSAFFVWRISPNRSYKSGEANGYSHEKGRSQVGDVAAKPQQY